MLIFIIIIIINIIIIISISLFVIWIFYMDIKLACLNLAKDFSSRVFNIGIFPNHIEKRENKYPKGKWLWRCPEMPEKRKLAC